MTAILKDWLAGLSASERLLIGVAAALTLALAAATLVLAPLRAAHADAGLAYEDSARLLAEVRTGAARAASAGGAVRGEVSAEDVRAAATSLARARGLAIARMSPLERGLSVRLDRADPSALYAWLAELDARHGITVRRASLRRAGDGATVEADLVLGAGGPS
jgi:type II secretory pathway component PulM